MNKILIKKLTGKAVALLVFAFLLVSSGQAFADVPNNSVTTQKIVNRAVTTAKIAIGAVKTGTISDSSIGYKKIKNGAIITAKIRNLAVTNGKLAADAVTTDKIVDGAVTNAKLGADIMVMRLGSGFTAGDTIVNATMSFDATYAAGGEIVSPGTSLTAVMIVPSKGGYVFEIDETSFSAGSFRIKAMETSDTTGAPLTEVTAGTDLSTITSVRYLAIGQ